MKRIRDLMVGELHCISHVHLVLAVSVTATVTTYPPGRHGTPERTRFGPLNVLEPTPQTLREPLHGPSQMRLDVVRTGPSKLLLCKSTGAWEGRTPQDWLHMVRASNISRST